MLMLSVKRDPIALTHALIRFRSERRDEYTIFFCWAYAQTTPLCPALSTRCLLSTSAVCFTTRKKEVIFLQMRMTLPSGSSRCLIAVLSVINNIGACVMAIDAVCMAILATAALKWEGTDRAEHSNAAVIALQLFSLCGEMHSLSLRLLALSSVEI